TASIVQAIIESNPQREAGYRASPGILSLAKPFTAARLEAASQRAFLLGIYSYHSLKSILKHSLDRQPLLELESDRSGPNHDNVRGGEYYDQPPTRFLQ